MEDQFLNKLKDVIQDNITNEQFGVSELANEVGMSRSNLLRKIKKSTNLSASQFIRQVRLESAMEMLRQGSSNVSEVAFKVGFSSTSYFIKCFGDYYGYPPGEISKREFSESGSGEKGQHQLAAIMFTDIQGYTALMQQDEQKAVEFRSRHREVFNAITKKFHGKILQYYGDGTLSTFNSAIDAVRCGIELQLAYDKDPKLPVRVGIHSGDIIFTEDDIIGDGVNVASRIESLSEVGSVFISEKVYDEVKNQSGIQTISLGLFELKNVGKSMEIFAIANPGLLVPDRNQIAGKLKNESAANGKKQAHKEKKVGLKWGIIILAAILIGYLIYTAIIYETTKKLIPSIDQTIAKKSIAVLPFRNDSGDSTNIYIINGLMESILNNLQKIEDLRVISRTSVEKYRNNNKTIPEIAKELNVKYFVEGSGQKIGDQILLNIQLIEGPNDKHLWAEQYNREVNDIFQLQMEVAKNIASKIEVIITPEEEERISKPPTENLLAYDYFLKGQEFLFNGGYDNLQNAIDLFNKAIEQDSLFAHAYADIAISYYLMDLLQSEKIFSDSINFYADRSILYDPKLAQSLMAKAFYYMNNSEYELAIPYLEKALEYNPNSSTVINTLSDFYATYLPNTAKYLEYALKGIQLDIAANDSTEVSFIYLHIGNAFVQSGFVDEAQKYINLSLDYNPNNIYAAYVKPFILYAHHRDLKQLNKQLIEVYYMDTTRLDVVQEIAKSYYLLRDYKSAYLWYKPFVDARIAYKLDIYQGENGKIAKVFSELGYTKESEELLMLYKNYGDQNTSIYKHLSLTAYYSYTADTAKAIEHLKLFAEEDNFYYWIVLFLDTDPLMDNIKDLPEFKKTIKSIKSKFWDNHNQIKATLEEKDLL